MEKNKKQPSYEYKIAWDYIKLYEQIKEKDNEIKEKNRIIERLQQKINSFINEGC